MPDTEVSFEDAAASAYAELLGTPDDNPDEGTVEEPEEQPELSEEGLETESDDDLEDEDVDEEDLEVEESEDESDEPGTATDPTAIELSEADVIRLPDGTEVPVKDAVLFQAGFTKKTQELAERTAEVAEKEKVADEAIQRYEGIAEQYNSDAAQFVRSLITGTEDPTYTFAAVLKGMADEGTLDPGFAETFGVALAKAGEVAERGQSDERLSALEQRLQKEDEDRQLSEHRQQLVETYLGQWEEVKQQHGLSFGSPNEERQAFRDLAGFAAQGQTTDLRLAYAAKAYQEGSVDTPRKAQSSSASTKRKSTSARVARRSAGSKPPKTDPNEIPSVDDAILQSLQEHTAQGA